MSSEAEFIAKEISQKLGNIIGVRVYVTLIDEKGQFVFFDSAFEAYRNFIRDFVKNNSKYLGIGDHSIPISNQNIMFFKTTTDSVTVLYNPKGKIGQLFAFKKIMNDYNAKLNNLVQMSHEMAPQVEPVPTVQELPLIEIKTPVISRDLKYLSSIKIIKAKKSPIKEKFTFIEGLVLQKSTENPWLSDLMKLVDAPKPEILDALYNLNQRQLLQFETHELWKISCLECKTSALKFIPKFLASKKPEKIRFQVFPEGCKHTCISFFDKKKKLNTQKIEKLGEFKDALDITNISLESLVTFFGQDLFFNMFHAIFFRVPIIFIGDDIESNIRAIITLLQKIFPTLEYGNGISSIQLAKYLENPKPYEDNLIIDFYSNVISDPYPEGEYFNFESKLFTKILKIKEINMQVLATNKEFERLILDTDKILSEIKEIPEISEDTLIKKMKAEYDMTIDRSEIPIIQKIAEIYYGIDVSKKIKRTLSGQMGGFFDTFHSS
jgi:hypothetical protein